jgi:hypothetical protein
MKIEIELDDALLIEAMQVDGIMVRGQNVLLSLQSLVSMCGFSSAGSSHISVDKNHLPN